MINDSCRKDKDFLLFSVFYSLSAPLYAVVFKRNPSLQATATGRFLTPFFRTPAYTQVYGESVKKNNLFSSHYTGERH